MLKKCLSRYGMIVFMTTEIGVPSFDFQIVQGNQLNLKQSWEGSKLSSSLIFKSKKFSFSTVAAGSLHIGALTNILSGDNFVTKKPEYRSHFIYSRGYK